jgi:hypothetical protein
MVQLKHKTLDEMEIKTLGSEPRRTIAAARKTDCRSGEAALMLIQVNAHGEPAVNDHSRDFLRCGKLEHEPTGCRCHHCGQAKL